MKVCKQWAVAVVYLLEKRVAHYEDITDYILSTKLTTLNGQDTPYHTIRAMLSKKKIDGFNLFYSFTRDAPDCKGEWSLNIDDDQEDEIRELKEVQYVYECLEEKKNQPDIDTLKKENERLRMEYKRLKENSE